MGKDTYVADDVIIKERGFTFGDHVAIDHFFYCTTRLYLGDYVHIGPHVSVIGGHTVKFSATGFNNIMAGARIICASDRFDDSGIAGALIPDKYRGRVIQGDVVMEPFSNIGTNAIVFPGSWLSMGVLVTAGSVLFPQDTVPWGVYKGNPAKLDIIIDPVEILKKAKEMGYEF